ncbi:MAG: hypothetical protein VST69_03555 [Nitrospirota bacterium]|nr:hypothetical protein [Nitrospirota bacterium]
MSKLGGHWKITETAVSEIHLSCVEHPLGRNLQYAELPKVVIFRDLLDVISLGHWGDYGQAHHFMRRFDGQSPKEAYDESIEWIYSNALNAAELLATRIRKHLVLKINTGVSPHAAVRTDCPLSSGRFSSTPQNDSGGLAVLSPHSGGNWQTLGNAIHALQDSFSKGHVLRETSPVEGAPGSIAHVKSYGGAEKHGHSEYDEKWADGKGKYSVAGRLAIDATKDLLEIVIETAIGNADPAMLLGWQGFKTKWLKASRRLSEIRNFVIDFVSQFYTGLTFGATNIKTANMNEEGVAQALLVETLSSTQKVFDIFVFLKKEFSSDADDIAGLYVDQVIRKKGLYADALARNRSLVSLLIKIMGQGWTSDPEKKYIVYLKSL